jgi:ubiquinone/menaquinone biosynthesis C-methylase UbiE
MREFLQLSTSRILRENGAVIILEPDEPKSLLVRLFIGLRFFYWLPLDFEMRTRRDMLKSRLTEEVRAAGFKHVTKVSKYRGVFQVVQGVK